MCLKKQSPPFSMVWGKLPLACLEKYLVFLAQWPIGGLNKKPARQAFRNLLLITKLKQWNLMKCGTLLVQKKMDPQGAVDRGKRSTVAWIIGNRDATTCQRF